MQVYMEGCDYWEVVEDDYVVAALPDNPTLNQIRHHKEMKTIKAYLYVVVSPTIFNRIMAYDSSKKSGISSKQNTKEMKKSRA